MKVEIVNDFSHKDLYRAYDVADLCVQVTPEGPIEAKEVTLKAFMEGNSIGVRTFSGDEWLSTFVKNDLEYTKLTIDCPEPPYDVHDQLRRGEAVFLTTQTNMNFLDCMTDYEGREKVEVELEVIIDGASHWADLDLENPYG